MQTKNTAERPNALIFEAIKKILEGEKKVKSAKVMPRVIWSHNTSVSIATNFSPFRLLFRAEIVMPEEIKHKSTQRMLEATICPFEVEEKHLLESDRFKAIINLQKYRAEMKGWRDKKVKQMNFDQGEPHTESSKNLESNGWALYDRTKINTRVISTVRLLRKNAWSFM
jgi:hypothetical protein